LGCWYDLSWKTIRCCWRHSDKLQREFNTSNSRRGRRRRWRRWKIDALDEKEEEEKSQLSLDEATDQMSFIISGPKRFVLRGDTDRNLLISSSHWTRPPAVESRTTEGCLLCLALFTAALYKCTVQIVKSTIDCFLFNQLQMQSTYK
jgi:hypothetical protein